MFFLSGDNRSILGASYTEKNDTFAADKPRVWLARQPAGLMSFDIAADGKRVVIVPLVAAQNEAATHVTFLLNFTDDLARRAPATK